MCCEKWHTSCKLNHGIVHKLLLWWVLINFVLNYVTLHFMTSLPSFCAHLQAPSNIHEVLTHWGNTHIPDQEIATGLHLFLDMKRPLFYQQCNWFDVTIQQFMPTIMCLAKQQQNSSLSSKFEATEFKVWVQSLWYNDPCPFKIFLSPLRQLCWLWSVLMCESKHFLK